MKLETFSLHHFGAYEYWVYEKALSNKIAHGAHNTPVFNEVSFDAPLCFLKQIIFYTSENVKIGCIFLTNNDIQL